MTEEKPTAVPHTRKELNTELERMVERLAAYSEKRKGEPRYFADGSPERAAARRSSMDLTRALAAWRKAGCP